MDGYTEVVLSDGTVVRARSVPPLMVNDIVTRNPELRDPPLPMVTIEGVAGSETVAAREGEAEYIAWITARDEIEAKRREVQDDFTWAYGVISWKRSGTEKFMSQPPPKWKVDPIMAEFGCVPRNGNVGRRIDYIKYELLNNTEDTFLVQKVILGDVATLTKEEVDGVAEMFPSDV